jgi:hypothetical protein
MEYTSEYRNENDAIAKFIDDNIRKIEPGEEIEPLEKNTLKKVFKTWKDNNDGKALLATDMIKKMEVQFGKYHAKGWTNAKLV